MQVRASHGLRYKAMVEIRRLRRQLTNAGKIGWSEHVQSYFRDKQNLQILTSKY